jgi:hypothetical protein
VGMGEGKRYSLKTDKNDEQTPGPIYKSEYNKSI